MRGDGTQLALSLGLRHDACVIETREQVMAGTGSGGIRRKLTSVLTAIAMVAVYVLGTVGVSSVAMTAGASKAEARGRRGRRGRGRGRRGRRGRDCPIVLWNLGLC